ncbi:Hypothetical predicted protein [Mytilus galloprovincialis]|uniref:Uncharacterized protein n=1 Tax=Mytilus galloprovincialis TaxID=29158 RepID=A0A8B6E9L9_MYTGA|nr:Hypothetical predicted protein [Mytilus galloprovincialis]
MNSHRKDSVLYDPDISLTEEQLSQEIDILTAELEKYRHVKDRSISQVDTPRTVFRHSDSGIGSVRRSEQLSKQTNSPIYEKNVSSSVNGGGLGARPRSSVRGQAQGVLGNLTQESRQDFKELVKALEERFSPSNQTELYRTQLRERHQRAVETLPELGQDIRRLTNLAYATAPNEVRETLAKRTVHRLVNRFGYEAPNKAGKTF